jgi:hypothetical protein
MANATSLLSHRSKNFPDASDLIQPGYKNLITGERLHRLFQRLLDHYEATTPSTTMTDTMDPSDASWMGANNVRAILIWKSTVSETIRRQTSEAIQEFQVVSGGLLPTLNPHRTGFIARPFHPDFEPISGAIEGVFKRKRIRATRYIPVITKIVLTEMLLQIRSAHFGVADVTSLNRNVLIELGAMIALGKPLVVIRKITDDPTLPFDIGGIDCFRYRTEDGKFHILDASAHESPLEAFVEDFVEQRLQEDSVFAEAQEYV